MAKCIVALDFPAEDQALDMVARLRGRLEWVKVGLELFCAAGPALVERLKDQGLKVFVDLKFHDIPTTAARAVRSVTRLGTDMLTVHAAGGPEMLRSCALSALETAPDSPPRVIGVTVLTSLDAAGLSPFGTRDVPGLVNALARQSRDAGLDGVVCSPLEALDVKRAHGKLFLCVTPGIRFAAPAEAAPETTRRPDDQTRSSTPAEAVDRGADFLVVGRPVTRAPDPRAALERILDVVD